MYIKLHQCISSKQLGLTFQSSCGSLLDHQCSLLSVLFQPPKGFFLSFFRLISETPQGSHWVEISVVEVYNNEVFDLLAKDNSGRTSGVKRDIVTNKEGKSDVPLLTYE